MRIVLTKAGQKEINDEINQINNTHNNPRYNSELKRNKIKYLSPKNFGFNKINKYKYDKKINRNISHSITDGNYLNEILKNKNSNTLKVGPYKNNNNYLMIKIKSSSCDIPREIQMLYSNQNSINIKEEIINKDFDNINKDNIMKNEVKIKSRNEDSLPLITNNNSYSIPIKDLLQNKNIKNIKSKIILRKKINKNENNLVNYLKLNKTIRPSFMEKIGKANENKLVKLDKICQKYFNNIKRDELMRRNIKDKIKLEYSNDSTFCKESLLNMKKNIKNYNDIYKSLENKKDDYFEKRYLSLLLLKK
jgi:hypothetical protein